LSEKRRRTRRKKKKRRRGKEVDPERGGPNPSPCIVGPRERKKKKMGEGTLWRANKRWSMRYLNFPNAWEGESE